MIPALLLALVAPPAPPAALPQDSGVREEVQVRLVRLPILAMDRQGRPVTDLTRDEIVVKERGRPREVAYLEPFSRAASAEPLPEVVLYLDAPGGWQLPVRATQGRTGHVLFFIDTMNDELLTRSEALAALLEFARSGLDPATQASVLSFDGTVNLDLPFTTDREALQQGLAHAWAREVPARINLESQIGKLVDRFGDCVRSGGETSAVRADDRCLNDVAREYAEEHRPKAELFLAALTDVLQYMGGLEGRKTVIAVTHGVTVDPAPVLLEAARAVLGNTEQVGQLQLDVGFGDRPRLEMERVVRLAVQRRVSLSFVDRSRAPSGDRGAKRGQVLQAGAAPAAGAWRAAQVDMEEIATATGGVFVASTDLKAGLTRAVVAETGGYEVGFYVERFAPEERKKLVVDTTRKGVEILHRRGMLLATQKTETIPGSRITLGAPAALDGGRAGQRYPFQVELDPKWIGYTPAGEEVSADFTLNVAVRTFAGRELVDAYRVVHHSYPGKLWARSDVAPVIVRGWVECPPGAYTVSAIVRNTESGKEGRLENAIEVMAP